MKKVVVALLLTGVMVLNAGVVLAADEPAKGPTIEAAIEQEIKLLRQDLRAEKKKLVAATMLLTEAESTKFWPVYDAYTVETVKLNDTLQALIKEYAQNADSMTDDKIKSLTKRTLEMDESVTKLRMKYLSQFTKAVGAKKAARFMQVDRRLSLLVNLQVASGVPLVQP
jgi:ABC-type sugar transport system ATPase subunit